MKILFDDNGKIHDAVYDKDWFAFTHSHNFTVNEFEIDEVDPYNKEICHELYHRLSRVDVNGLQKYHMVDNAGEWELYERDGWILHEEPD